MPAAQHITLRLSTEMLERIEENAEREGMNRTAYILSWLPENYARHGEAPAPAGSRA